MKKNIKMLLTHVPVVSVILILIFGRLRLIVGCIVAAFGLFILVFIKPVAVYMRKKNKETFPDGPQPPLEQFQRGMIDFGLFVLLSGVVVIIAGLLLR